MTRSQCSLTPQRRSMIGQCLTLSCRHCSKEGYNIGGLYGRDMCFVTRENEPDCTKMVDLLLGGLQPSQSGENIGLR